jgi:bifunctional NMN adenylyltransferase/nudix hydrolase
MAQEIRGTVSVRTPSKRRIAVYIGRFQPFHRGHEYVLNHCLANYDETIVLIGSAYKARDVENPFTYEERKRVLYAWLDNAHEGTVRIRPLRDHPYNDAEWIKSVQEAVNNVAGPAGNVEVTVVGCDRDSSTWYLKTFPQWGLDVIEPYRNIPGLSATQVRERYFGHYQDKFRATSIRDWPGLLSVTAEFLIEFEHSPYFKGLRWQWNFLREYHEERGKGPFVTADICVVQSGHVLVIERGPETYGAGLLALPGGFVKPHQRIKDAAVDECMEETGILLAHGKRDKEITRDMLLGSIKDWEQFDHPRRSLRGRIFTTCYLVRLNDTKPLPQVSGQLVPMGEEGGGVVVETKDAKWMPIAEALDDPSLWFEDHHAMVETMLSLIRD